MRGLAVKTTVIDWQTKVLEITDTTGVKHTISLDKAIQVTMVGFPEREIKSMPARDLGKYMSSGYIIEHISFEEDGTMPKKDTSPFIKPTRVKRMVRIQEVNAPPSLLFDTDVEYPSDDLPEWFAPLQAIIEDDTVDEIDIRIGAGRVLYHITVVGLLPSPHH